VVTSARGAAVRDILNILRRRHETVNVLIYPAQVQGDSAPSEVASGIRYFNRSKAVDVIIVARGGGSLEDLAAFNDEALARIVADSRIPIISAIGHETDFTIIDFVADLRAPTPSAAAELVVQSKRQIEEQLDTLRRRLARATRYRLLMARQELTRVAQHAAFARMHEGIARRQQRLDDLRYRMAATQREQLRQYQRRLEVAAVRLRAQDLRYRLETIRRLAESRTAALIAAANEVFLRHRARLDQVAARLRALSPLNILERGYALVFDATGSLVKSADQVKPGDEITARLNQGNIRATVKET